VVYLNSKIIVSAVVVVLAVALIYIMFFSSQEYSFGQGVEEINSFWAKQDLKPNYLTSPLKVYAIEKSSLTELKADLTSFRDSLEKKPDSEDKEKLMLLTETEIELIDNALLQKENFNSIDFFDSVQYNFDVLCSSMNKIDEFESNLLLQKESAETVNEKIIAFSSDYPSEAGQANITELKLNINSAENLAQLNDFITALKGAC